ncbi:unnamed protein product [Paramecium pentaurelia]|uniref:Cyclic nucleotide-binding domain-containing protein n=1 Tax=Paramecium pentaurelia TaxID=43138 RepID=A0A8S1S6L2_9CILI|nr:unnamed protein product [Paramecium pentaurelia]
MDQEKSLIDLKQALTYRNRSKEITDIIVKGVQDLKFFREKQQLFDPALYCQMLKKIQLKEFKKGEVVFHYGSNNVEQFYVILQGQVAILCPNDKSITHQQVIEEYQKGIDSNPSQIRRSSAIYSPRLSAFNNRALKDIIMAQAYGDFLGISNYSIIQLIFLDIQKVDQQSLIEEYTNNPNQISVDKWLDNLVKRLFPSLHIVNMCCTGDQFGEIALIGKVTRTATVLCTQDTAMITLANPDFQAILQQYHDQVKNEKISLLRNFELFSKLTDKRLRGILENIIVQKPSMFSIIYMENSIPEYIYFIKQGEIELLKVFPKNKTVSITLLQVGCVFGHEEVQQSISREYRAISKSSQCELYLLPVETIQQFEKKNSQSLEKKFHHERLQRLLSDKKSQKNSSKITQNSIEQYKTVFEKDYSNLFSHELLQKRIISPRHKKIMTELFTPLFDVDKKCFNSKKQLTDRKTINTTTTRYNKENSTRQLSTQTTINIHRHLFSPKVSKRQLDTIMPFKKILSQ